MIRRYAILSSTADLEYAAFLFNIGRNW